MADTELPVDARVDEMVETAAVVLAIGDTPWFIHEVDRWPAGSGPYGSPRGNFIYIDLPDLRCHFMIAKINLVAKQLVLEEGVIIDLGDSKSSWDLFKKTMADPWDATHEKRYRKHDDYADYAPVFAESLEQLADGTGKIYGLRMEERRAWLASQDTPATK